MGIFRSEGEFHPEIRSKNNEIKWMRQRSAGLLLAAKSARTLAGAFAGWQETRYFLPASLSTAAHFGQFRMPGVAICSPEIAKAAEVTFVLEEGHESPTWSQARRYRRGKPSD